MISVCGRHGFWSAAARRRFGFFAAAMPNTILHVDMDAFYASVEQRDRPELRGKPVIVGGSGDSRGVVCAASYEARTFGVHSAMPAVTAKRLCPHGIFLPPRMVHYTAISRQIQEILLSFTPLLEPLSLDEAFLDIHGCESLFGPAGEIARKIKAKIKAELDLIASIGVAPNKFLAKLASDMSKPNGLLEIDPDRVIEFLSPLPVGRLWGVGAKAEKRLHLLGIQTIGQLAGFAQDALEEHFGQLGPHLRRLANGQDDRPVIPDEDAKSVSTETTFARDIGNRRLLRSWLLDLVEHLGQRLRRQRACARTIDIKVRTADFQTYTRSKTLWEATDVTAVIWQAASQLFDRHLRDDWLPLRLLGVGAAGLVRQGPVQGDLFDDEWRTKQRALDQAADQIRRQFGKDALRRGAGLDQE
jgi:DNA polymerase-4